MSVEEAERRDPKGLYKKARAGVIKEFTGISAPYEEPEHAEIVIRSKETSVEEAVVQICKYLEEKGLLKLGRKVGDESAKEGGQEASEMREKLTAAYAQ